MEGKLISFLIDSGLTQTEIEQNILNGDAVRVEDARKKLSAKLNIRYEDEDYEFLGWEISQLVSFYKELGLDDFNIGQDIIYLGAKGIKDKVFNHLKALDGSGQIGFNKFKRGMNKLCGVQYSDMALGIIYEDVVNNFHHFVGDYEWVAERYKVRLLRQFYDADKHSSIHADEGVSPDEVLVFLLSDDINPVSTFNEHGNNWEDYGLVYTEKVA